VSRPGLFAEIAAEEIGELSARLRPRRYARGQIIFSQGDPGAGLGILASGRVNIVAGSADGRELVLNALGPGDFFGEQSLLDGGPRSADAVAQEACQILWLGRDDFVQCLESRPRVAVRLLTALSRRMRDATQQAQDALFLDVPGRLARTLLRQAEEQGEPVDGGVLIPTCLTQSELAGMAGTTRETLNKCLRCYVRRGIIRFERGQITILKPDALRRHLQ
jgi:CRP-like cAMP-binding protein